MQGRPRPRPQLELPRRGAPSSWAHCSGLCLGPLQVTPPAVLVRPARSEGAGSSAARPRSGGSERLQPRVHRAWRSPHSPRSPSPSARPGGSLTAVILVAVVRAVVVLVASPHGRDAASVPAPELVLWTLRGWSCGRRGDWGQVVSWLSGIEPCCPPRPCSPVCRAKDGGRGSLLGTTAEWGRSGHPRSGILEGGWLGGAGRPDTTHLGSDIPPH